MPLVDKFCAAGHLLLDGDQRTYKLPSVLDELVIFSEDLDMVVLNSVMGVANVIFTTEEEVGCVHVGMM